MRSSAQLDNKTDVCEFHKHTGLTTASDEIAIATSKKQIIRRLLEGEPIDDIQGEMDSLLTEKKIVWENYEQRLSALISAEKDIKKYVAWESSRNDRRIFPNSLDLTINYEGEEIIARPDFFINEGNAIKVCRIKTSKYKSDKDDLQRKETYALHLLGKKLFPDKNIMVEYLYLKNSTYDEKNIKTLLDNGAEPIYNQYKQVSTLTVTPKLEEWYKKAINHEKENPTGCSQSDCMNCPMNNICNYKEAPLSIPAEKRVAKLSDINPTQSQRDVINFKEGIARVNAGAGAGKTFVIAARIAKLLEDGVKPEEICLLTFTKTGAEEMTARAMNFAAEKGIPLDPENLMSTTINAFCQHIITDHYQELGYTRVPRVIPDANKFAIINKILDTYPKVSNWKYGTSLKSVQGMYRQNMALAFDMAVMLFSEIKQEGYTRDDNPYKGVYGDKDLNTIFLMYAEYENELKKGALIEYADQLTLVMKLLEIKPDLFEEIGYKHILIDEFQDTDYSQIQLLNKMIDTTKFESFMAVGDDSQSIFGFRHTSPEYMINFETYFGHFRDFPLLENHRSVAPIIEFANKINAHAHERVIKDLVATKLSEEKPQVHGFYSAEDEHQFIAEDIKKRWEAGERDIAVLTSDRHEIADIAARLTELGIPSVSMNPVPYKENCRVAALISFFDSFSGKSTQGFADYQNILAKGELRNATGEQLELIAQDFAEDIKNTERSLETFKVFAKALDETELDEVYKDFREQLDFCENMDELNEFIENFKIYGDKATFKREGKYDGICLITVHSAKGLEWDTTYLTLSKFDKSDRTRSYNGLNEFDEKIRKFFVGATRARKTLIMSSTYQTSKLKSSTNIYYNPFLEMAYEDLGKAFDFSADQYRNYLIAEENRKKAIKEKGIDLDLTNIIKSKVKKKDDDKPKKSDKQKAEEKENLIEIYKSGAKPSAYINKDDKEKDEEEPAIEL